MKLLVLGGTSFLGRHLVEAARKAGHDVTFFHRGQTNPELFPGVDRVLGDRDGGLEPLRGRRFDAVADMSGHFPRHVRASAELLADAQSYCFASSISVYVDFGSHGFAHGAEEHGPADDTVDEMTGETYGGLKIACENEVRRVFDDRALIVRPGLIVGPHDPSDRFTYWPDRLAAGGDVLAPAPRERLVQVVDGRDLAAWMLSSMERGLAGTFDATGPAHPLSIGDVVGACLEAGRSVAAEPARVHWVEEAFLLEHEVEPWTGLPLWVPETDMVVDVSPAVAEGLCFRPLAETVADTLEWCRTRPADHEWRNGLPRDRERELLVAWQDGG